VKVYLAGKIEKNDWRHVVVPQMYEINALEYQALDDNREQLRPWPVIHKGLLGEHDYTGPYFVRCDHGCYHGAGSHGVGVDPVDAQRGAELRNGCQSDGTNDGRSWVVEACLTAIRNSHIVFAWLDTADAYGTLFEIGFARSEGLPVVLAGPREIPDLWFTYQACGGLTIADTPQQAVERFFGPRTQATAPLAGRAIETEYQGYRFRSRLEARWAVFFNSLGVAYEYEKEGFDLGDGRWYLPDFWLPSLEAWVEIKPTRSAGDEEARVKCQLLANETRRETVLVAGNPWPDEYTADVYLPDHEHSWGPPPWGRFSTESLLAAYRAARQARFEHGERG
jgi:hypothetical protein